MQQDMTGESRSKHNWISKVEDVPALSAEALPDKNAAWEKLYSRLNKEPCRSMVVWYWAAAACLMLVFILTMMNSDKIQEAVVRNSSQKNKPQPLKSTMITGKEKITVSAAQPSIQPKKAVEIPLQVIRKKIFTKNEIDIENTSENITADKKDIKGLSLLNVDTIQTIAHAPVKSKLRVVHINELDPAPPVANLARSEARRTPHFKFINPEVYTGFSLPQSSVGFTILKHKQAPSN